MREEIIQLKSNEGVIMDFKKAFLTKTPMLKRLIVDLEYAQGGPLSEPIPLSNVTTDALRTLIRWLEAHKDKPAIPDEERAIHRFNRYLSKEDRNLFGSMTNAQVGDVIQAAYFLDVVDLMDVLVKFSANNLEGTSAETMCASLGLAMKKNDRKNAADDDDDDDDEEEDVWANGSTSQQKKERC